MLQGKLIPVKKRVSKSQLLERKLKQNNADSYSVFYLIKYIIKNVIKMAGKNQSGIPESI